MAIATGYFDKTGSPSLKVKVAGPLGSAIELEAIIDTGYTGFVLLPAQYALALGLAIEGTSTMTLADASKIVCELARVTMSVSGMSRTGITELENNSKEVLVGMDFLRQFGFALMITSKTIVLIEEADLAAIQAASKPELDQPVAAPTGSA